METQKFMEHAVHLCNFDSEQLEQLIDWDGVENLPNTATAQDSVRMLSQYLVGNQMGTAEELMELTHNQREKVLVFWTEVIQDTDTLRNIARYVSSI